MPAPSLVQGAAPEGEIDNHFMGEKWAKPGCEISPIGMGMCIDFISAVKLCMCLIAIWGYSPQLEFASLFIDIYSLPFT